MGLVVLLLAFLLLRLGLLLISLFPLRFPKQKLRPDNLQILFGGPGSGKTTYAAWLCRKYLASGIPVYSNVPIVGAFKVTKEDIGKWNIPYGLLIIDEAGIEYNNRDFAKNFNSSSKDKKSNHEQGKALEWYKKHRHEQVEVAIFSQGFDDMDLKLRTLANELYVVRKIPGTSFIFRKRIRKKPDIDELQHQPIDKYEFVPFGFHMIWGRWVWKYFDSFERMGLPDKTWDIYEGKKPDKDSELEDAAFSFKGSASGVSPQQEDEHNLGSDVWM